MADPVFVLLKPGLGWIEEKHWKRLLGAVVKNHLSPLDAAVPSEPLQYNRIVLNENTLDDFVLSKAVNKTSSTALLLTAGLELRGRADELNNLHLEGKQILVKRLQALPDFWKLMTEKEDEVLLEAVQKWRKAKKDILRRPNAKVYWITGLLLCQDVNLAASREDVNEQKIRGEVPTGTFAELAAAAHGAPIAVGDFPNIVGEASRVSERSVCLTANAKDTQIFALQLQRVVLKGQELDFKDEPANVARARQLGGDDEIEELVTMPLDDESLAELLAEGQED